MKIGDLVRIKPDFRFDDSGEIGIIKWADAHGIYRHCGIYMLNSGIYQVYLQKNVEVISESR